MKNIRQQIEELDRKISNVTSHSHVWLNPEELDLWVKETGGCEAYGCEGRTHIIMDDGKGGYMG